MILITACVVWQSCYLSGDNILEHGACICRHISISNLQYLVMNYEGKCYLSVLHLLWQRVGVLLFVHAVESVGSWWLWYCSAFQSSFSLSRYNYNYKQCICYIYFVLKCGRICWFFFCICYTDFGLKYDHICQCFCRFLHPGIAECCVRSSIN